MHDGVVKFQIVLFVLALAARPALAQGGKPSTPEDRAKAVRIAGALEADPLSKEAKDQRTWITRWLIDVPDINVKLCAGLLGPVLEGVQRIV